MVVLVDGPQRVHSTLTILQALSPIVGEWLWTRKPAPKRTGLEYCLLVGAMEKVLLYGAVKKSAELLMLNLLTVALSTDIWRLPAEPLTPSSHT